MKTTLIQIGLFALLATAQVFAQSKTNTFPDSGNVGIGTTNPGSLLALVSPEPAIDLVPQGGQFGQVSVINFCGTFGFAANGDAGAHRFAQIRVGSLAPLNWDGAYLGIWGITPDGGEPSELIHINTWSGKIGVGTQSPDAKLTIQGDDAATVLLNVGGSSNGHMRVRHIDGKQPGSADVDNLYLQYDTHFDTIINTLGGNVGIGTSTPDARLTIQGDPNASVALNVGGSTNGKIRVRHIEGKSADSSDAENLLIQYDNGTYNTYINCGTSTGNVAIGTWSVDYKLNVNGTIRAKEVIVDSDWADYVFADDYKLQSLDDVEQHIKETKHLPGIPSAQEVSKQGVSLGDMQTLLLSKIEELTLHQIELNKRLNEQSEKINALQQENATLKSQQ